MRALLSVSDKTGVLDLARELHALGVSLISTGGTAKLLADAGLPVTEVAEVTGFPEMLDGRVKTLHPKVHGGLLARRDTPEHMAALAAHGIDTIDLLVVNLYPFESTVAKPGCTLADAIENIDIGGPAMVRSAAKNWKDVAVLTDASQYAEVVAELKASKAVSDATRFKLAVAAFNRISNYDGAISDFLSAIDLSNGLPEQEAAPQRTLFPAQSNGRFVKLQDLRYGENSHQQAALYRDLYPAPGSLVTAVQLQGKELSYNNIADADAAWECVKSFEAPACVIVKHANPCGVAVGAHPLEAYSKAFQTDPTSAFGGIIAFNRTLDEAAALQVSKQFVEVLMAPGFTPEALAVFKTKVNVRILQIALPPGGPTAWDQGRNFMDAKRVGSGLLLQTSDIHELKLSDLKVVTKVQPTEQQLQDLLEGGHLCQEQCHRVLRQRHDLRRGCRPDEPPGFSPHRQHQGPGRRAVTGRHSGGQRCVLPLPRWPGCGGGCRCYLHHPARWQHARPGSDRCRRRARRGHGVQRRAPLQALMNLR